MLNLFVVFSYPFHIITLKKCNNFYFSNDIPHLLFEILTKNYFLNVNVLIFNFLQILCLL